MDSTNQNQIESKEIEKINQPPTITEMQNQIETLLKIRQAMCPSNVIGYLPNDQIVFIEKCQPKR